MILVTSTRVTMVFVKMTDKSDNGIGDDSKSDDGNMSACDGIDINEKDDTGDNIDDGNIDESNNKDDIKLRCILLGGDQFSTSMG